MKSFSKAFENQVLAHNSISTKEILKSYLLKYPKTYETIKYNYCKIKPFFDKNYYYECPGLIRKFVTKKS